eukprot:1149570-Pelagomonas_calceolata.AAC.1
MCYAAGMAPHRGPAHKSWTAVGGGTAAACKKRKEKKAYAGRNQRALRKDPTVSAVTNHESHQYLN